MDGSAVLTSHMCDNLKLLQRLCDQLHNADTSVRTGQRRACPERELPTRSGPRLRRLIAVLRPFLGGTGPIRVSEIFGSLSTEYGEVVRHRSKSKNLSLRDPVALFARGLDLWSFASRKPIKQIMDKNGYQA
jgi:hypothetical protein